MAADQLAPATGVRVTPTMVPKEPHTAIIFSSPGLLTGVTVGSIEIDTVVVLTELSIDLGCNPIVSARTPVTKRKRKINGSFQRK